MGVSGAIMATAAVVNTGYGIYQGMHQPKPSVPTAPNTAMDQITADRTATAAANAQKKKAAGAQGYQSTLLTGPLGIAPQPVTGKKTLLGS